MTFPAAIGLGSNLGDRRAWLGAAVRGLADGAGSLRAVSSLYESEPIGGPRQGRYLNAVAVVDTSLAPGALLAVCLALEEKAGRVRRVRWEARTLDLDLLLYDRLALAEPGLTVPHPRMGERRFVLQPLVEIWPQATFPDGSLVAARLPLVAAQGVEVAAGPGWWIDAGGRS